MLCVLYWENGEGRVVASLSQPHFSIPLQVFSSTVNIQPVGVYAI